MHTGFFVSALKYMNGSHLPLQQVTLCVFCCRAYVRYLGLSVNQPLHILGCGDFNIDRIEVADEPVSSGSKPAANGVQSMDMAGSGARLLAVADPAARQGVVRLNTPDPLAGEQTWPTTEVCVSRICCAQGLQTLLRLLQKVWFGTRRRLVDIA